MPDRHSHRLERAPSPRPPRLPPTTLPLQDFMMADTAEQTSSRTIFRPTPFVTTGEGGLGAISRRQASTGRTGARLRPISFQDSSMGPVEAFSASSSARASPMLGWTQTKKFELPSDMDAGAKQASMSARGTRKEEFEYLTRMLRPKNPPSRRTVLAPAVKEEGGGQVGEKAARKSHHDHHSEDEEEQKPQKPKRGLNSTPWVLPTFSPSHRPLRFKTYGSLYDVAAWSGFSDTQEFAGNGIAALSSIPADRDVLQSGGAVQYMVDLLLNGKTFLVKCDACEALVAQFNKQSSTTSNSDLACREFVNWTGVDRQGMRFTSGFAVAFRLRRSKSRQLQRAGADLLHVVLLHPELKHIERISVDVMTGLSEYCKATDEEAACKAAKTMVAIFKKVLDTGILWTAEPVLPVLELLRNTEIFTRVRSLIVRAIVVLAKEGESVLRLLSNAGAVKSITLQLVVREDKNVPFDADDRNYVRVLTQICDADHTRYEDVILIGGAQRIIHILRKHLVKPKDRPSFKIVPTETLLADETLLPDEVEMQRRCMRFLERVLMKPALRMSAFEAGTPLLYLDILEMDKSQQKVHALAGLEQLCEDADIQAAWHTLGALVSMRMAGMLHTFAHNAEFQNTIFRILKHLCSNEMVVGFLVGSEMLDCTIAMMDKAVKNEDRTEMEESLASGVQFLQSLVQHKLGREHVKLWIVIGRVDPNMRKVRGLLITHDCNLNIWKPYDDLIAGLE